MDLANCGNNRYRNTLFYIFLKNLKIMFQPLFILFKREVDKKN